MSRFGLRYVSEEMQEYITAAATLKQQTGLSLVNRCEAINSKYGFPKMNPTLLRRIYRVKGIKKKAIQYKKVVTPDMEAQLPELKEQLRQQLAEVKREGFKVIYI